MISAAPYRWAVSEEHDEDRRGPDLPSPEEPWTLDVYRRRWPFATKVELLNGIPYWTTDGGPWDERDVQAADRTFPGWRAVLEDDGHTLTLRPAVN